MHVLATAGHVDHGKSTLVRALTGMEPDRFAEERRRGMTIDLGYAWTTLPSGAELAFVDVPGHQRFIANMLAGVGPAPGVLFVVAADNGWSRQSEEHLAAIDALDVRAGALAVTRSDLADPAPAMAQARERLGRSSLGEVPAVACSGHTGVGLPDLTAALDRLVTGMGATSPTAPVRLWVDRSFTARGSGTVVTGTLSAGAISVGDSLYVEGQVVHVRGLQSMGTSRDHIEAPARVALNLRGVSRDQIGRGDALTAADWWRSRTLDVRLSIVEPLPAELMLHVGTAAEPVRVRPLAEGLARLTLTRDLPIVAGDRAVLRDPGRQTVAAGVLVLDADPPPLFRRGASAARAIEMATMTGRPDPATELRRRGTARPSDLRRLGVDVSGLAERAGWLVDPTVWERWVDQAGPLAAAWTKRHPLEPGPPAAALSSRLGLPDEALVGQVIAAAGLHLAQGRVVPAGFSGGTTSLGAAEQAVREVEQGLTVDPFAAPDAHELTRLRLGRRELAAAERAGRLVRISAEIVLLPSGPAAALERLGALEQPFTTSQARQTLGTTRRVVIPLLEYLDGRGCTERVDDLRRRVV